MGEHKESPTQEVGQKTENALGLHDMSGYAEKLNKVLI